jgi:hypothetical protein
MISEYNNTALKVKKKSGTTGIYYNHNNNEKYGIITGATSGIGKAFAFHLAQQGFNLIITGRKPDVLKEVASELKNKYDIKVIDIIADLAVKKDVINLLRTIENLKRIDILINNAGYGLKERFHQDEIGNQLKMLRVHVTTPIILIHKVLTKMKKAHNGTIINVSSMGVYLPTAGNAMYIGTKSFLHNFTLSLHMDLQKYGIRVQCLCPGLTHTDFHKNMGIAEGLSQNKWAGWMEANEVVRYSLTNLKNDRVLCIPGRFNRIALALTSILPANLLHKLSNLVKNLFIRSKESMMPEN